MKDSAAIVAMFAFLGVFFQALFNHLGARSARQHEVNLLLLKQQLDDENEREEKAKRD